MEGPTNGHRTFFVSGSTDGLGLRCCNQLAESAPAVTDASKKRVIAIHGRNPEKIAKTKADIEKQNEANAANFEIISFQGDLSDMNSVKKLADDVMAHFNEANPLDVFMNNAGIWTSKDGGLQKSACGKFEQTFMANVIAVHILLKKMLTGPPATVPKKIVVTSSGGHKMHKEPIDVDNFNFEKGEHSPSKAYSQSKLLVIMLEVAYFEKGMIPATTTMLSFCPGWIGTNMGGAKGRDINEANETFTFATSDKYDNAGGRPIYYKQYDADAEVNPQTLDKEACLRVYDHLEQVCKE